MRFANGPSNDIGIVVVEALKAAGYAESTIGQYLKSIRILALLAGSRAASAR